MFTVFAVRSDMYLQYRGNAATSLQLYTLAGKTVARCESLLVDKFIDSYSVLASVDVLYIYRTSECCAVLLNYSVLCSFICHAPLYLFVLVSFSTAMF